MLDDKIKADFDQASALINETYPQLLWSFYDNLKTAGFSDLHALELTKVFLSNNMNAK